MVSLWSRLFGPPLIYSVRTGKAYLGYRPVSLIDAAERGGAAEVRSFLAKGSDINEKDDWGDTALISAALRGHLKIVQILLANGADVNAKKDPGKFALSGGVTALMNAAGPSSTNGAMTRKDYFKVAQVLLANGADVNAKNDNGKTALMYAAEDDHFKVAQFLLAKGADVNAKDNDGETALMKTPDYSLVIQVLLAKGADINAKKNNGETALIQASTVRRRSKVQMLLANGADVNAKDNDGMTALMGALMGAEKGIDCLDVVQTLIANGADVNAKDNERRPMLALATAFGFREVVETLRANGADVNAAAAAPALRGASAEQVAKINRLLDLGLRQSRDAARARRVLILKYLALVVAVPALLQYHMSPKPISSLLKLATLDQAWQSAQDIFNVTSEMVITAMAVLTITLGKSFDDAVWNFGCRLVGYFLAIAVLFFFVGSVFGLLLLLGREIVYWLGFQWIKGARVFDASPEKLATTSNPAAPVQPRGALAARLIQYRNWFRT